MTVIIADMTITMELVSSEAPLTFFREELVSAVFINQVNFLSFQHCQVREKGFEPSKS